MSADIPDVTELAALSADADKQEQALIVEYYNGNWRDIKIKVRYTRYWRQKHSKL